MRLRTALASVVGGVLGGLLGAGVMSAGHALVTSVTKADAPPAAQEEDATVKVAGALAQRVRGRPLAESEEPLAGHLVHYGFGAFTGLVYGVAALVSPLVTIGAGTAYGAAVWLGAHATVVPALGLAPSPLRQPVSKEALELVLHLAYGLTVGVVQRIAVRTSR